MKFWNLLVQGMVESERVSRVKMGLDKFVVKRCINRYERGSDIHVLFSIRAFLNSSSQEKLASRELEQVRHLVFFDKLAC